MPKHRPDGGDHSDECPLSPPEHGEGANKPRVKMNKRVSQSRQDRTFPFTRYRTKTKDSKKTYSKEDRAKKKII